MKVDKKTKGKTVKIDYLKIGIISISIYFLTTFVTQQFKINQYNVKSKYYQEEITARENKINDIEETIQNVDSSEYQEKIAREELGLVKPYEKIFIDTNK